MRILFTGSSSFTGYWFIKALLEAGHHVIATFTREPKNYQDIRKERVKIIQGLCPSYFGISFGSDRFLKILNTQAPLDVLCHHGAEVTDYKSPAFDPLSATYKNTHRIGEVLTTMHQMGCKKMILTGSLFEPDEGQGTSHQGAFSPYGLSKRFTYEIIRFHAEQAKIQLGKFVIPNPFGPFEENRFTSYLMKSWMKGEIPLIKTPRSIRDNIPVSLLAKAYAFFVIHSHSTFNRFNPSGYKESMKDFAQRCATEVEKRLSLACRIEYAEQTLFEEPQIRVNTDEMNHEHMNWNESLFWDEFIDYYSALTTT